eukprot:scaffold786_cov329-Pavlova_lutheri.AAC.4
MKRTGRLSFSKGNSLPSASEPTNAPLLDPWGRRSTGIRSTDASVWNKVDFYAPFLRVWISLDEIATGRGEEGSKGSELSTALSRTNAPPRQLFVSRIVLGQDREKRKRFPRPTTSGVPTQSSCSFERGPLFVPARARKALHALHAAFRKHPLASIFKPSEKRWNSRKEARKTRPQLPSESVQRLSEEGR